MLLSVYEHKQGHINAPVMMVLITPCSPRILGCNPVHSLWPVISDIPRRCSGETSQMFSLTSWFQFSIISSCHCASIPLLLLMFFLRMIVFRPCIGNVGVLGVHQTALSPWQGDDQAWPRTSSAQSFLNTTPNLLSLLSETHEVIHEISPVSIYFPPKN